MNRPAADARQDARSGPSGGMKRRKGKKAEKAGGGNNSPRTPLFLLRS